jgi:Kef-type K+ transport system membrane component KefB
MAYQVLTAHVEKLKRWANTKVNVVLNIIDTVFWFALFVITIMGAMGSTSTSSKAVGAIIIILALILWYVLLLWCLYAGLILWVSSQWTRGVPFFRLHQGEAVL